MRLAAYVMRMDREPLYRVADRLHAGRWYRPGWPGSALTAL